MNVRIGVIGVGLALAGCASGGTAGEAGGVSGAQDKAKVVAASAPATTKAATTAPTTRRATGPEKADVGVPRGGFEGADKPWTDKHNRLADKAKKGGIEVYFEGDSITEGWGGSGKTIWDKELAPLKASNFGIGGDKTQHVLWRIENGGELDGVKPKAVVLMIGTNNSGSPNVEETASGVKKIVEAFRSKAPDAKILLIAIFPRGANKDDAGRKRNEQVNAIIAKLDDGKHVKFLNFNEKFLQPDGTLTREIMPDLLHLSPKGYQIWADAIREPLKEILGK